MRTHGIDGFTFLSARDRNAGINIGLFNINSFANKTPDVDSFQTWQCNITKQNVEFIQIGTITDRTLIFPLQHFLINGELPFPSADYANSVLRGEK